RQPGVFYVCAGPVLDRVADRAFWALGFAAASGICRAHGLRAAGAVVFRGRGLLLVETGMRGGGRDCGGGGLFRVSLSPGSRSLYARRIRRILGVCVDAADSLLRRSHASETPTRRGWAGRELCAAGDDAHSHGLDVLIGSLCLCAISIEDR